MKQLPQCIVVYADCFITVNMNQLKQFYWVLEDLFNYAKISKFYKSLYLSNNSLSRNVFCICLIILNSDNNTLLEIVFYTVDNALHLLTKTSVQYVSN